MSDKGYYKKLVNVRLDDDKSQQRASEKRFYDIEDNENVGRKPKSAAKPNPRADHKHEYVPVVIWRKYPWNEKICGSVGERCRICGKKKQDYTYFRMVDEPRKYYGEMEHFWEENGKLTPIDKNTYRKTIFLGGSQTVNALAVEVKNKLVDFMNLGHKFVIGDCKGADLEMQKFLAENSYQKVTVYYSGNFVRINIGGWGEKKINSDKLGKGYELYKQKDEQMALAADEGFMIFKELTRGTTANIERLVSLKKECSVAFPERGKSVNRSVASKYNICIVNGKDDIERLMGYLKAREL